MVKGALKYSGRFLPLFRMEKEVTCEGGSGEQGGEEDRAVWIRGRRTEPDKSEGLGKRMLIGGGLKLTVRHNPAVEDQTGSQNLLGLRKNWGGDRKEEGHPNNLRALDATGKAVFKDFCGRVEEIGSKHGMLIFYRRGFGGRGNGG